MIPTLYACVHAAEFPAQALLRLRTDLRLQPVVVLEGKPPQEIVCSLNRLAKRRGLVCGVTRHDAEETGGIHVLARSAEVESSAASVLLEYVSRFSPRIEVASSNLSYSCVLDIAGTERLFGPSKELAERLHSSLADSGFRTSIAVSQNYHAALMKAHASRGINLIPTGEEAGALADLPVSALDLSEDHLETFVLWGIATLGELAALPEVELVMRFGSDARIWHELSRGIATHVFRPFETALRLEETYEFEDPVEQMDSLLFIGTRMIECLSHRAANHMLSISSLSIHMRLEDRSAHQLTIRPALPTTDRKFLLKLLQLELAAHPPQSAVVALTISAEPGMSRKMQLGLFAPQTPEPSRLDVTIARLKALVGEDRVGSAVLDDSHRPDSFHIESFSIDGKPFALQATSPHIALRRIRPAMPVRVVIHGSKPAAFRMEESSFQIKEAYGPWRTSGCWWSTSQWDAEEWDVLAMNASGESRACLLLRDCLRNEWRLEAYYD
ncbi:MAG TPA: hypothetical protein VKR52_02740 [Terracidiphilus sp.]|nr:hypothetical protein [Terracidiphilus sp.]